MHWKFGVLIKHTFAYAFYPSLLSLYNLSEWGVSPYGAIPSLGAMGPGPGHLGKFFSARRRRRPWRDQPTTNLPTYLPTYMPKMKHTWYWLRVSTWIILRKKIWAQYYRQIDRNSDIYLVSMVLSHFEKSHFLKKVSPDRLAHIRHVSFCKILHCLPLGM